MFANGMSQEYVKTKEVCCEACQDEIVEVSSSSGPGWGHVACWGRRQHAGRRARTALKRVAGWLRVPWSKAVTFETLLAHQAAAGEGRRARGPPRSAASWAKIGAASVGAGALFAVTGAARNRPTTVVYLENVRGCMSDRSTLSGLVVFRLHNVLLHRFPASVPCSHAKQP